MYKRQGDVYETQQALTAYLKSPEKDTLTEKYDQFIEKYMGACDGHSSERIAAMINQYMEAVSYTHLIYLKENGFFM